MHRTLSQISNGLLLVFLLLLGADAFSQSAAPLPAPALPRTLASDITGTTATLSVQLDNPLAIEANVRFIYGKNPTLANGIEVGRLLVAAKTLNAKVSVPLTGLQPKTIYFFKAISTNGNDANTTKMSALNSFETGPAQAAMVITKASHANVTDAAAELSVDIGNAEPSTTSVTFFWGLDASLADGTPVTAKAYEITANSMSSRGLLAGLKPATTYFYGAVATTRNGTAKSTIQSFKTNLHNPPQIVSASASQITEAFVYLHMRVRNTPVATQVQLVYGTDASLATSMPVRMATPVVGPNSTDAQISAPVSGLQPKTTYYFRAIASNPNGTATSSIGSFLTAGGGAPPVVTKLGQSNVGDTTALLSVTYKNANLPASTVFVYSADANFAGATQTPTASALASEIASSMNLTISGLKPETTYYYLAQVEDANGKVRSITQSFKTTAAVLPTPPTVTASFSDVTSNSANLHMTVKNVPIATNVQLVYGTDASLATNMPVQMGTSVVKPAATGSQLHAPLYGLKPKTTYYFKATVSNANGTATSGIGSFTTSG
jgi:phosphodiesterase/alkaline phosphatase D-like protein